MHGAGRVKTGVCMGNDKMNMKLKVWGFPGAKLKYFMGAWKVGAWKVT